MKMESPSTGDVYVDMLPSTPRVCINVVTKGNDVLLFYSDNVGTFFRWMDCPTYKSLNSKMFVTIEQFLKQFLNGRK